MTTTTRRSPRADRKADGRPAMLRRMPTRPDSLAFSIAAIVIVLAFGLVVAKTATMTRLDLAGSAALTALHTGFAGWLGAAIYTVFSPAAAIGLTIVIAGAIALAGASLRLGLTFAATIALTWVPSDIVKIVVHRVRPDAAVLPHHLVSMPVDPSYPSGHMVYVTTLALAFVCLAGHGRWRSLAVGVGIVAVVVVALALVSDGVHYPSDVVASIVWSLGVAPLILGLWNRFVLPRLPHLRDCADDCADDAETPAEPGGDADAAR